MRRAPLQRGDRALTRDGSAVVLIAGPDERGFFLVHDRMRALGSRYFLYASTLLVRA